MGDLIPDSVAYVLVLLFGGLSVAVFAFRQFDSPIIEFRDIGFHVLDTAPVALLGGQRAYVRGFIVYLAIFELVYFIFTSSSLIMGLAWGLSQKVSDVGPIFEGVDDNVFSNSVDPLTPILASTLIITFVSVKPFADLEHAVRQIAYRAAGIPENVFDLITRIKQFNMLKVPEDASPSVREASTLARRCGEAAAHNSVDASTRTLLVESVARIFGLYPWAFGPQADRIWSQQRIVSLTAAIEYLKPKIDNLRNRLHTLLQDTEKDPKADLSEKWEMIASESKLVSDNIAALFGVLIINHQNISLPGDAPVISRLIQFARYEKRNWASNAVVGAVILGSIVGFLAIWIIRSAMELAQMAAGQIDGQQVLSIISSSMVVSFSEIGNYAILFIIAASIAVGIRSSRVAAGTWVRWGQGTYPFTSYTMLSILTYIFTVPVYLICIFIWIVGVPFVVNGAGGRNFVSFIQDFLANSFLIEAMIGATSAFFFAWFACYALDAGDNGVAQAKHNSTRTSRIAGVVIFSGFIALVSLMTYLWNLNGGLPGLIRAVVMPTAIAASLFGVFAYLTRQPVMEDMAADAEATP